MPLPVIIAYRAVFMLKQLYYKAFSDPNRDFQGARVYLYRVKPNNGYLTLKTLSNNIVFRYCRRSGRAPACSWGECMD